LPAGSKDGKIKKQINGAVAQLGACLNGIQEVAGSIPASSTFFVEYAFVVDFHHSEFLIRWGCLEIEALDGNF
jgi:hypothetical protein